MAEEQCRNPEPCLNCVLQSRAGVDAVAECLRRGDPYCDRNYVHCIYASVTHLAIFKLLLEHGVPRRNDLHVFSMIITNSRQEKSVKMVECFIDHGADPNTRDEDGCTPLHIAAVRGNLPVVKALLGCGADRTLVWRYLDTKTPLVETAAEIAEWYEYTDIADTINNWEPLAKSVRFN